MSEVAGRRRYHRNSSRAGAAARGGVLWVAVCKGWSCNPDRGAAFSRHHRKTGASGVKRTSSPRWRADVRRAFGCLLDHTAVFGAQPRGRRPMPRSSRRWAAAPLKPPKLPRRSPSVGFPLNGVNNCKEGCWASAARQAVGGSRGAVVKPRTLLGPSTGSHCGWVVCPRRARWTGRNAFRQISSDQNVGAQLRPRHQARENCK